MFSFQAANKTTLSRTKHHVFLAMTHSWHCSRYSQKTGPVPKKKIKLEKQAEEDMNFYEVDSILAFKKDKRGNESVLIHWKGYDSKFDSWEPVNHVNAEAAKEVDVLRDEWQKKKKKAKH